MLEVFIDGLAEPTNPGIGTFGFVIYKDGKRVKEAHGFVGERVSNNFSEYHALCEALRWILERGWQGEEVIVKSDSLLLVNQMSGRWRVRGGLYAPKHLEALSLAKEFDKISFVWIPRGENAEADSLSRRAYEIHLKGRMRMNQGEGPSGQ
ncbi:MAG: ribonuclease HI family protein [Candidatus Bathyarchaeia archaeon]